MWKKWRHAVRVVEPNLMFLTILVSTKSFKRITDIILHYEFFFTANMIHLGGDYMVQFQPGLKLSPVDRAEISAQRRSEIDYKMQQRLNGENSVELSFCTM